MCFARARARERRLFLVAEMAEAMKGAHGRGWDFVRGERTAVLRHLGSGLAIALPEGSSGWVRLKRGETGDGQIEHSNGDIVLRTWPLDESNLLQNLMDSPGTHTLTEALRYGTAWIGSWTFTVCDNDHVVLTNPRNEAVSVGPRLLTEEGYERLTSVGSSEHSRASDAPGGVAAPHSVATPSETALQGAAPAESSSQ